MLHADGREENGELAVTLRNDGARSAEETVFHWGKNATLREDMAALTAAVRESLTNLAGS